MAMVSAAQIQSVSDAFLENLNDLEIKTKTPGLQGDMESVSKRIYKELQERMHQKKGLEASWCDISLNSIESKFYSRSSDSPIVIDLKKWVENPSVPLSRCVWYQLCFDYEKK